MTQTLKYQLNRNGKHYRVRVVAPCWWIPRGITAIAFYKTIYVRKNDATGQRMLLHEICHIRQWRAYGCIEFPIRYIGQWIWALGRASRMPFEKTASTWYGIYINTFTMEWVD